VRTPEELSGGVIGHPINIDIYSHDFSQKINELDKKKTYLVYCRSGNRSKTALEIMKQLGFENVYEIDCGIVG
jgi:rhodanese-related sulfurtransferase